MKMKIAFFIFGFALSAVAAENRPLGFTATVGFQMPKGTVELSELDVPPSVMPKSSVVYPADLVGSGVIGRIGGFAILRPDGSVVMLRVSHGNDRRFKESVEAAAKQWSFTPPMKDSHAVGAYVHFQIVVSERGNEGPYLIDPKKDQASATAPSGRGSP